MTDVQVRLLREYEEFDSERFGLNEGEWARLEVFARRNQQDRRGNFRPVLAFGGRKRTLKATNFVGILSTKRGTPIEILPKIDLAPPGEVDLRQALMELVRRLWEAWPGSGGHFGDSRVGVIEEPPEQKPKSMDLVAGCDPLSLSLTLGDGVGGRIEPAKVKK